MVQRWKDVNRMNDDTICVIFCNWHTANEMIEKEENIERSLVITSYLDDNEVIVTPKDEFLEWLRGGQDG